MSSTPETFVDLEFVVERNYSNWRLDKYICQKLPRLSRTKVQRIIDRGLISDRALKSSTLVFPGLSFRMRRRIFDEPETPTFVQELYRDRAILVVDKPAGLPIHPTARYRRGTLVTLLRQRYGPEPAFPLHRLDRETSGVLVCGCEQEPTRQLMRAFAIASNVMASTSRFCRRAHRPGANIRFGCTFGKRDFPLSATKSMGRTKATSTGFPSIALNPTLGAGCAYLATHFTPV